MKPAVIILRARKYPIELINVHTMTRDYTDLGATSDAGSIAAVKRVVRSTALEIFAKIM